MPAKDECVRTSSIDIAACLSETAPAKDTLAEEPFASGDDDCFGDVHKASDVSDEDRSTVAPSDFDVSSDEDQSSVDIDSEFHTALGGDVRTEVDVGEENHVRVDCSLADVCCEDRGATVTDLVSREDKVSCDVAGSEGEAASGQKAGDEVDIGWEDRGAVAAAMIVRRISSRAAPVAEVLPLPAFPGSRRRRVRFDFKALTLYEIPPYSEIYGAHPRTFVFDRHSRRVPAAPNGYVSLEAVMSGDDDEDTSDSSSDEEEVTLFGKGTRSDLQEDREAEVGPEDSWESYLDETSDVYPCSSPTEHACIPSCGLRRHLD